jgi:hypothetical protein
MVFSGVGIRAGGTIDKEGGEGGISVLSSTQRGGESEDAGASAHTQWEATRARSARAGRGACVASRGAGRARNAHRTHTAHTSHGHTPNCTT